MCPCRWGCVPMRVWKNLSWSWLGGSAGLINAPEETVSSCCLLTQHIPVSAQLGATWSHTWALRDPRCWVPVCARGRHCSWAPVTPSQGRSSVAAAAERPPCSVMTPPRSSHLPISSAQVPRLGGTFRLLSWGFLTFLHSECLCRTMCLHVPNKRGKQNQLYWNILKYSSFHAPMSPAPV